MTLDDGSEFKLFADWIKNEGLDHWKGWKCDAGRTRLFINSELEVYSGFCFNDHLGNVISGFEILENGTICQRDRCSGCTDDLALNKSKD